MCDTICRWAILSKAVSYGTFTEKPSMFITKFILQWDAGLLLFVALQLFIASTTTFDWAPQQPKSHLTERTNLHMTLWLVNYIYRCNILSDWFTRCVVDISRNRFTEIPREVCEFSLLEKLDCYNNSIRSLPESIARLQYLKYLNLRSVTPSYYHLWSSPHTYIRYKSSDHLSFQQ